MVVALEVDETSTVIKQMTQSSRRGQSPCRHPPPRSPPSVEGQQQLQQLGQQQQLGQKLDQKKMVQQLGQQLDQKKLVQQLGQKLGEDSCACGSCEYEDPPRS